MTSAAPDDGDGDAEVVVFRRPPAPEDEAREIARQFPGWHVWYSPWAGTWDAHREGEKPYFGPVPRSGRVFMVTARHASGLVTLLEDQVRADITAEFPGWRVKQIPGGWCATCGDGRHSDDGTVVQLVYHPAAGGLLRALRARCAGHEQSYLRDHQPPGCRGPAQGRTRGGSGKAESPLTACGSGLPHSPEAAGAGRP